MPDMPPEPRTAFVPLDQIALSGDGFDDYLCRFRLDSSPLEASLAASGLAVPLTLEKWRSSHRIISGFRRVAAARSAGLEKLPALVYAENALPPTDALRLALAANSPGLALTDADRACALAKARDRFHLSEDDLIEAAPSLGLPPSFKVVRQFLDVASLPVPVVTALASGETSRQHALALLLAPPADRGWLFSDLVTPLRLSASDTRVVTESALDLADRAKRPFRDLLSHIISSIDSSLPPARAKAALKDTLARRLSPVIIDMADEFDSLRALLQLPPSAAVEHSPGFEADEITLTLRAASLEDVRALADALRRGLDTGAFASILDLAKKKTAEFLD